MIGTAHDSAVSPRAQIAYPLWSQVGFSYSLSSLSRWPARGDRRKVLSQLSIDGNASALSSHAGELCSRLADELDTAYRKLDVENIWFLAGLNGEPDPFVV
jgi:hypothetical protein